MFSISTELLIRMVLVALLVNLVLLPSVLWYGIKAIWSAHRVLRHIDLTYIVQRNLVQQHTSASLSQGKEEVSISE